MYKQVIIIRMDLKMSKGKAIAQACHASLGAYRKAGSMKRKLWEIEGEKKVVLRAESLEELLKLKQEAEKAKLPAYLVIDAGLTELPKGTVTALAIGPDKEGRIDKITGKLKAL